MNEPKKSLHCCPSLHPPAKLDTALENVILMELEDNIRGKLMLSAFVSFDIRNLYMS